MVSIVARDLLGRLSGGIRSPVHPSLSPLQPLGLNIRSHTDAVAAREPEYEFLKTEKLQYGGCFRMPQ